MSWALPPCRNRPGLPLTAQREAQSRDLVLDRRDRLEECDDRPEVGVAHRVPVRQVRLDARAADPRHAHGVLQLGLTPRADTRGRIGLARI